MPTRKPMPPPANQSWQMRAACRGHDPELWFPPPINPYSTRKEQAEAHVRRLAAERKALAICHTCPVRAECYDWAVATNADGVWGGTTEEQRGHTPTR